MVSGREQLGAELLRCVRAAEARPDREHARLGRGLACAGPRHLHGLEQPRLDDGERSLRDGDDDVAGVRPEGGGGREADSSGQPRRAAGDEHRARAVLVVVGPLARDERENVVLHEAQRRLRRLEPDVRDHHVARLEEPGRDHEARLAAVEGDGELCADGRAGDLARRGVDPGRDVDGHDRGRCGVDPLDRRGRLLARRAVEAGPEEGVHDHVRLLDRGRLDRVPALLAQDPGGDAPVAAVRAAAADDGDPAARRDSAA